MAEIKPTVISTFAGCGGSSLGYHLAGFQELLAVEWDDNAAATFKLNFPDVPLYHGDIAKLSVEECLARSGLQVGQLDIFDGSPPCQGFSTAGKRKFDDSRNSLFKEYVRLLKGLQPKVFVMENVTGMIKGVMKQAYLQIVSELRSCGYNVKGQVMNAMYYNVPQSRQRVIIIGVREDLGLQPSHPKPQTKPITVREAFLGLMVDEDERQFLLNCGRKYAMYKHWSDLKPGQSGRFGDDYKLNPDGVAKTVNKSSGNTSIRSVVHFSEKRRPTTNEFKRLSSFPDGFSFSGEFKDKCACIGNSVPPNLMKAIALHIKQEILAKSM